jgi:hypothetical protein
MRRGAFRELPGTLTAAQLDDMKHRTAASMRRVADLAIGRGRTVLDVAYSAAHLGMLKAQTEDEVDRIQRDFARAVRLLKQHFDTFDEAFSR